MLRYTRKWNNIVIHPWVCVSRVWCVSLDRQHWSPGEPGSGSSAKVNPSPMCSLLTCRSPWLRESVRIHGMEFLDLCGVLGRYAHLSVARDISTACPYNSGKNNVPQEIVIMKSPLTHHSYTFHDIFYEFLVSPCFPPCFDLFSFHISQTPQVPGFGQRQDDWS